jgi:hypothetical protein
MSKRGADSSAEAETVRHAPMQVKTRTNEATITLDGPIAPLPRGIPGTTWVKLDVSFFFPIAAILAGFRFETEHKRRKLTLSTRGAEFCVTATIPGRGPALTETVSTRIIM